MHGTSVCIGVFIKACASNCSYKVSVLSDNEVSNVGSKGQRAPPPSMIEAQRSSSGPSSGSCDSWGQLCCDKLPMVNSPLVNPDKSDAFSPLKETADSTDA